MTDMVPGCFDSKDVVRILCPECGQESALRIVDKAGQDGFRIDKKLVVRPEFVCLKFFVKPNGAKEYCGYCNQVQIIPR